MAAAADTATPAQLEDTLGQLHAMECAVRAEFLKLVGEYGASEAWRADGARSIDEWLCARFSLSRRLAYELARVAEALRSLPRIAEAFAQGHFSWDQLRALTRYATPETDATLAEEARGLSLAGIEGRARRARRRSAEEAQAAFEERSLRMYWRGERLHLSGDLVGDRAAVVEKTLLRTLDRQARPPQGEPFDPFDARLADALYEICSGRIAADPDPDRATVVLHAEADILRSENGVADLEGIEICAETARRLCCDARVQEVLEIGGIPIGVGRTARTVPPWMTRLLRNRDQGCRFPGCSRRRWVHAHHILHWVLGGPTDLGNLLFLCSYHHTFLHEGRWTIRGDPTGEVRFVRPDGTILRSGPPGLRPEMRNLLFGDAA